MTSIRFFVPGIPQSAGSKNGFRNPNPNAVRKVIIVDTNARKVKPWRQAVVAAALDVYQGDPMMGPISVTVEFFMPRPKRHYRTGKNADALRDDAEHFHTSKPDRGKLLRALEDALTGVIWRDDAQVCAGTVSKVYSTRPGASVVIERL